MSHYGLRTLRKIFKSEFIFFLGGNLYINFLVRYENLVGYEEYVYFRYLLEIMIEWMVEV